jgi:RNA polymerase sigma-70 factor (ECF subfamily)
VDEQAFRALYDATAKPLSRYIVRVCGKQDVADDLLQERYFRLLRSKRADMPLADARPYLFRIASNLLHDRWRRGQEFSLEDTAEQALEVHPEKRMDAERMLQGLKPRARELLWLAYVEEMTHREIAAVTGLNVMSIRILLQRARREAQVMLESRGTDHG